MPKIIARLFLPRAARTALALAMALPVAAGLMVGSCDVGPLGLQAIAICDDWYRTERWGAEIPAQTLLQDCQVQSSDIDVAASRGSPNRPNYTTQDRMNLHRIFLTEGYALLRLERWPEAELAFNDAIEVTQSVELPNAPGAQNKKRWNGVALYGRAVARERQGKRAEARADFAAARETDMMLTPELRQRLEDRFGRYRTASR